MTQILPQQAPYFPPQQQAQAPMPDLLKYIDGLAGYWKAFPNQEVAAQHLNILQQQRALIAARTPPPPGPPLNINPMNPQGNDLRQPVGAQVGGIDTGMLNQLRPTNGLY